MFSQQNHLVRFRKRLCLKISTLLLHTQCDISTLSNFSTLLSISGNCPLIKVQSSFAVFFILQNASSWEFFWGFVVKHCASLLFSAWIHSSSVFHYVYEGISVCVSVCELSCDGPTSPCVSDETFVTFLFAVFRPFCPFFPMPIKKWDVLTPKMKKDEGKKKSLSQSIILPEKASGEKEQAREEERAEKGSLSAIFSLGWPCLIVSQW